MIASSSQGQITGIKISGDTCTSLTLALQAEGTSTSSYFFWNFGDPASGTNDTVTITGNSPSPFPTHTFSSPGVYTVCVTFQDHSSPPVTVCRTISIGLCCSGIITFADSCLQNNIGFTVITGATINSISWDFGDPASASNTSSLTAPAHIFSAAGSYQVTANINASCGIFAITSDIDIVDCSTPLPCIATLNYNDTCADAASLFEVNSTYPINSVQWNFGDPASGSSNISNLINTSHIYADSGFYVVQVIADLSCGIDTVFETIEIASCDELEETCNLFFPNVFTPNTDNVNDEIFANFSCEVNDFELYIFNRWGSVVYKSVNAFDKWDGKYNKIDCSSGVYYYVATYTQSQSENRISGSITLLR